MKFKVFLYIQLISLLSVTYIKAADNIIYNGDFAAGDLSGWSLYFYEAPGASANVNIVDNECRITDIVVESQPEYWHIQLLQTFTQSQKDKLNPGKTYELSFDARTLSGNKDLYIFLGQNEATWIKYLEETITINETMQHFSFLFTVEEVYDVVRLMFGVGKDDKSIVFDNIRLEEKYLKVLCWNILEGGKNGLDTIFQIIESTDADVVLIQESSTANDSFINKAVQEGYYYVQNNLFEDWWTLFQPALLSKYPIISSDIYFRLAIAEIALTPEVHIKVHSCHFGGNGPEDHYHHMKQMIREYLQYDKEKFPTIYGGDLNEWPFWTDVTGQLLDAGFIMDVRDTLEYIYSWGLEAVPGTAEVLGDIVIGQPYSGDWPSDHNAIYVEYYIPEPYIQETQTFTLRNKYQEVLQISADDFTDHFPKGGLTAVQFLDIGHKGILEYNSVTVTDNDILDVSDLDDLTYSNTTIGYEEIEWLGIAGSETANTSSFLYIENTGIIDSFDRKKCYYDVDFLNPGIELYFGSSDVFSSTSIDDLEGAEFVKFPTYIAYFSQFDKHNNYFLLNLDTSVYVYLAFDDRHNTPPWWIEGSFTRLNSATFTSNEHDYIVYRKYAGPGNFTFGSIYMDWEERTNTDNFIFVMVPVPYINTTEDRKNNLQEYPLLYPNPAPDLFILDLGREYQNVSITLYDVSGKLIKFFEFYYKKVLELNADFCPPGIYFLKIVSKESASIIKFIKE